MGKACSCNSRPSDSHLGLSHFNSQETGALVTSLFENGAAVNVIADAELPISTFDRTYGSTDSKTPLRPVRHRPLHLQEVASADHHQHLSRRQLPAQTALLPPGPIGNVIVTPGDRQVTISWDAPSTTGGAPVTGYLVKNFTTGQSSEVGSGIIELVRTGLVNGTAYQFQIRALSLSGPGPAFLTDPVTPYGVPSAPNGVNWGSK